MRSFAVVAFIGAAVAMPQYEAAEPSTSVYQPAYPVETPSSAPAYPVETPSSAPAYPVETPSSSAPAYEASSAVYSAEYPAASSSAAYSAEYPASSSAPAYAASTPAYSAEYPASSSSAKYEEYPVTMTSTKVVPETTFVCPTPTVVTYEEKTYSVTEATTLTISSYSTVVIKTTKTPEAEKPSTKAETPVYSATVPPPAPTHAAPYPSKNVTVPHSVPQGTATGAYPTSTKPTTPEFTGAAAQAGVGLLAVVGALAAFL